ncbi:MAG: DNA polymerase III subunit delta [Deltaproteobacteria bacterium]|nr:DNA polymerase III subunit delta [Deltaproteobacteria bacterium]
MTDVEPLLADIAKGKALPVYLVVGEEFLARKAAQELVDALVPKNMQGLNLTVMDAPSPVDVARDLATLPMFRGAKVVWAREPEFLLPKKGRVDALSKAREAWLANRRKDAARRVLGIAARAGWTAAQLDPSAPGGVGREAWKQELDIDLADVDMAFLADVARFCKEEGLTAPEGDASVLEALLAQGLPKGHALVIEASAVDGRSGLYKKLAELGEVVERKVERELRKLDIRDQVAEALAPFKKRMGNEAQDMLKALCGGNMRLLASEVEKLALYVGERPTIEPDDVKLLVLRAREEEFLELANAVQSRDVRGALAYVDEALGQGTHGLQIVGALASILRRLIDDKERYARMKLASRLNYRDFQDDVYPELSDDAKATGKKPPHPYVAFLGFQAQARFSRAELLGLLRAVGECDLELKTSAPQQVALERVLLRLRAA